MRRCGKVQGLELNICRQVWHRVAAVHNRKGASLKAVIPFAPNHSRLIPTQNSPISFPPFLPRFCLRDFSATTQSERKLSLHLLINRSTITANAVGIRLIFVGKVRYWSQVGLSHSLQRFKVQQAVAWD